MESVGKIITETGTGAMKKRAVIPVFLHPEYIETLMRIGRDFDGGYLVDSRNLSNVDALVSIRINEDWSFEEHFYSLSHVPVYAYDATICQKAFTRKFILALKSLRKGRTARAFRLIVAYRRFFRKDRVHIGKMVGMNSQPGCVSVTGIVSELSSAKISNIFFKIKTLNIIWNKF